VWLGYSQTLRPVQRGVTMVVDLSATAFISEGPLVDFVCEELRCQYGDLQRGLTEGQRRRVERALKGIKFRVSHRKARTFKCAKLDSRTPLTFMFENDKGGQSSIKDYFQEKWNVKLKYPKLPCIVLPGKRGNALPMELCEIVPGQRLGKLSASQTAGIIKHAAVRPSQRQQSIQRNVTEAGMSKDVTNKLFGVEIAPEMLQIKGRVLPPPVVSYGGGRTITPDAGAWNLRGVNLYEPKALKAWGIVVLCDQRRMQQPRDGEGATLNNFLMEFKEVLESVGMSVGPPAACMYREAFPNTRDPLPAMMEHVVGAIRAKNPGVQPQLVLVVIPEKEVEPYKAIKFQSDVRHGVPSQCLVAANAAIGFAPKRDRKQYLANVALKINAKLGGINSVVSAAADPQSSFARSPSAALSWLAADFGNKPFMFLGADVTHSVVKRENSRSIAAVVGSMNASATRYATRICCQTSKDNVEIIEGMKDAVKELLREFYNNNRGKKPERIVFYRDGVSEGQFAEVLQTEFRAIKQACQEMGDPAAEYSPPVTLIIVQKRHHTRLFAANEGETERSGNILPGTVVDSDICHPFEYDFFLNSHAGIQGTNKPAHYHVLVDENGFTPDTLQLLTYRFCFMYCRATRSVSLPPPAYYAHLAAFRGRMLLGGDDDSQGSEVDSETGEMLLSDVHQAIKSTMFYM